MAKAAFGAHFGAAQLPWDISTIGNRDVPQTSRLACCTLWEVTGLPDGCLEFAHGQPMAPYNTTQFLLNDREERTTNRAEGDVDALIDIAQRARAPSGSDAGNTSETGSGGGAGGSHSDSDEFERDFEAEYDSANVERLDTLSRADLIREYLSLERELENAMSENRELRRENGKLRAAAPRSPLPPLPNDTSTTLTV
uniref:Uncharacterized protein n=1 Tax=Plectus sambesii TaxID=2011161 RepID=A0A914VNR4_9BILA